MSRIDYDAFNLDYPDASEFDDVELWNAFWRYDPERVALARAVAQVRKMRRVIFALISRIIGCR